jgi:hypothetical protein
MLFFRFCFIFLSLYICGFALEPQQDEIAKKITAAKDTFYAERDKAEQTLIDALMRKEATAKQAGDLKSLEAVRAELDAFRKEGKLPKLVPLTTYEMAMKSARTKLENVYLAAIKTYTQNDKIEQAKGVQTLLEEFRNPGSKAKQGDAPKLDPLPLDSENPLEISKPAESKTSAPPPAIVRPAFGADPLQANTVWRGTDNTLTITERKDDQYRAVYTNGKSFERQVRGTIKDGKLTWVLKDVVAIKGQPGGDHYWVLERTDKGFKLNQTTSDGKLAKISLTLVK